MVVTKTLVDGLYDNDDNNDDNYDDNNDDHNDHLHRYSASINLRYT